MLFRRHKNSANMCIAMHGLAPVRVMRLCYLIHSDLLLITNMRDVEASVFSLLQTDQKHDIAYDRR